MVDSLVAVLEPLVVVVVVEGDLEVVFAAEVVIVETCSKVGWR